MTAVARKNLTSLQFQGNQIAGKDLWLGSLKLQQGRPKRMNSEKVSSRAAASKNLLRGRITLM